MGLTSWLWPAQAHDAPRDYPLGDVFNRYSSSPGSSPSTQKYQERKAPDPVPNPNGISTFDEIATQFERYRKEARSFKDRLQKLSDENKRLSQINHELRNHNGKLQNGAKKQKTEIERLSKLSQTKQASSQNQAGQNAVLNGIVQKQENRIAHLAAQNDVLQKDTLLRNDKFQIMQFELELLKCTAHRSSLEQIEAPDNVMHMTPQPFVVVLIDGDAYSWAPDLFDKSPARVPGAMAAIRLKNEVLSHILESPAIPPTAKVLAKVYINASTFGRGRKITSFTGNQLSLLEAFRIQFTETMPLFDFVDVGIGKERADEKIRENFHLLLANPCCHRIFLAACTDNGFARMLEQYQYNTQAYEKILLVSPGYVESEIARLGFREVVWPAVFAKKMSPGPGSNKQQAKRQQRKAFDDKVKQEMVDHNKRLGLVGTQDRQIAGLITEIVKPTWSQKLDVRWEAGTGLKTYMNFRSKAMSTNNAEAIIKQIIEEEELD